MNKKDYISLLKRKKVTNASDATVIKFIVTGDSLRLMKIYVYV